MKTYKLIFISGFLLIPFSVNAAATCSRANLTRCLDSVCAINVSSNPAARCQYCGTANAGTPPSSATAMRSVSVGQSAKYTISDKDLKKAPTDPGQRYTWAINQCLNRVEGCTPDDVEDTYDQLIEQSCTAAGISAQMATLHEKAKKMPTRASCDSDIRSCMLSDNHCGGDYSACSDDAMFDRFFSECSVSATNCDQYTAEIRTGLLSSRTQVAQNAESVLTGLIAGYQDARDRRLASAKSNCTDNMGREKCIQTICANNMRNHCAAGYESEKSMATQLCKFYDLACNVLK